VAQISTAFRERLSTEETPTASGCGLIVLVVDGNRLKILGFEHLIAIEATHIIYPVASRQNLCTAMLAELHKMRD
jgi:hypothetical protein